MALEYTKLQPGEEELAQERLRKQSYLKNEIIDRGYNRDDFVAFLNQLKSRQHTPLFLNNDSQEMGPTSTTGSSLS